MIIKMKKVYYCEYCGRHGLRPLLKHEKHCTSNPDRECRLCGREESVKSLINKYKTINNPDIENIKNDVDDCPNCVLTIIKGLKRYTYGFNYNYGEELNLWWNEHNDVPEE